MANLLDTLLTNGVQQSAPNVKPFQMGEFLTNAGQLKNVNESMNELDRQNSIRKLVAQREKEGIPFEQLSDEVAKYDLEKAYKMRGEARNSYTWNREESEAELANHKKYMAGWLGGEVLRRATEAVGNGTWDYDTVVRMCNKAAAVIFPYDPSTATALINFGKQGLGAAKKESMKPEKKGRDDEVKISTMMQTWTNRASDPTQDPYNANWAALLAASADNVLKYKNADKENRWITTSDVNAVYNKMRDILGRNLEPNDPKYFDKALNILTSMNDSDVAQLLDNVNGDKNESAIEALDGKGKRSKVVYGNVSNAEKLPSLAYSSKKNHYRWVPNPSAIQPIQSAIDNAKTIEDLKPVYDAIASGANLQGEDNNVYNNLKGEADKKKALIEKESEELKNELGKDTPEARLIAKTLTARGKQREARRLSMMGTVANGIFSATPFTLMDNMLMVQSPDYQITDDMRNTALRVHNGEWDTAIVRNLQNSKGFLGKIAQDATVWDALEAGARDAVNTIRPVYQAMLDECSNQDEVDNLNHALQITFGWPKKLFKVLADPDGSLGDAKTIKEESERLSKKPVNVYTDEGVKKAGESKVTPYEKGKEPKKGKKTPIPEVKDDTEDDDNLDKFLGGN